MIPCHSGAGLTLTHSFQAGLHTILPMDKCCMQITHHSCQGKTGIRTGRSSGTIKFMFPHLHSHRSAMQESGLRTNNSYKEQTVPYNLSSISRVTKKKTNKPQTYLHMSTEVSKINYTHDPYFKFCIYSAIPPIWNDLQPTVSAQHQDNYLCFWFVGLFKSFFLSNNVGAIIQDYLENPRLTQRTITSSSFEQLLTSV